MEGFERVDFDFSGEGGLAAIRQLEDILSSGHWSDRPLDYNDERTMLLLRLIRFGDIVVYKREFTYLYLAEDEMPDLWRRAEDMNMFINKRYEGGIMLVIADIFSGYKYEMHKTEYNSLFFPDLKAYVRSGGLPPDRLFGLLERDGCENVFLFPGNSTDKDNVYFAFALAIPKAQFLEELGKTNERIMEMMYEISRKLAEKNKGIIPPIKFDIPKGK